MSETRANIEREIAERPGIHFNELTRSMSLAPGQVQYHVRRLIGSDRVVSEQLYGKTHYYPPGFTANERGAIAVMRRETARGIVLYLLDCGPDRPAAVAADLDIARSTLEWHLERLMEQDIVEKRNLEANRVELALVDRGTTVEILAAVEPSVPDRMVDRFTRMIDDLFDG